MDSLKLKHLHNTNLFPWVRQFTRINQDWSLGFEAGLCLWPRSQWAAVQCQDTTGRLSSSSSCCPPWARPYIPHAEAEQLRKAQATSEPTLRNTTPWPWRPWWLDGGGNQVLGGVPKLGARLLGSCWGPQEREGRKWGCQSTGLTTCPACHAHVTARPWCFQSHPKVVVPGFF